MPAHVGDHLIRGWLRFRGFKSRFVNTYHGRMHLFDAPGEGEGAPIVLVHGISANAGHWGMIMPRLRRLGRRVVAVDLLGHGFSDDHDELSPETVFGSLGDVLEREVPEPFVLIGNSLGGGLSLGFAQVRPERVHKLLLLSPGGGYLTSEELEQFVAQFHMLDLAAARDFIRRLYARMPWYAHLIPPVVRQNFRRPSMMSLVRHIRPEVLQTPETLGQLRVPTAVLWGRCDKIIPRQTLEFFKQHMPTARFDEPEHLGHCPQIEHPRDTLRWIAARVAEE